METNDIKKALYKQKPTAYFVGATRDGLLYHGDVQLGESVSTMKRLQFLIPLNEIGDAKFISQMASQLLIRYLQ